MSGRSEQSSHKDMASPQELSAHTVAAEQTIRLTQHSTAQHSTAQHSTAQHSTAQHSTAQHRGCAAAQKVPQLNITEWSPEQQ